MSDPDQTYGAIPPTGLPPGGPPPPPHRPPPPPPPPPGAGNGRRGNGLWVGLAVLGMLALAGVIVGLVLALTGGDEGDDKDSDADSASSPSALASDEMDDDEEDGSSHDSPDPTDGMSGGPVDPSTSAAPKGTSTADAVANEPRAVVQAFFDAATSGDCATAEDLVTAEYLDDEGDCDPDDIPSDIADQFDYTVGDAEVDDAAGTATVPVTVDYAGQPSDLDVKLVKVGGKWRINNLG